MSKISIAMATYCGERYVRQQLESLLSQDRKPDEVIIHDDCSKDNTATIVQDFIAKNHLDNWYFEVNKENKGFIKNFADIIAKTTGDIIFFCDQDDIWHKDKLSKIEALFDSNPDVTAINSSFRFIDENNEVIVVEDKPNTTNHNLIYNNIPKGDFKKINQLDIIKANISPGCTMAIRKEVKDFYLNNTKMSFPHDHELNILASILGNVYFLNEELISYRIHGSNVIGLKTDSSVKLQASRDKRVAILNEHKATLNYVKSLNLSDKDIQQYLNHLDKYLELRRGCILKRNVFCWLKMINLSAYLKPQLSNRQLLGDLVYALRLEKFMEK